MAKEDKQNFMSRLVQGWQNFFNGKQEQHALKPFPKNHFFSPEELDFLSNSSDKLSPIEQWAVSSGRWGYERSKDTTSLPFSSFAPVQWQDGLMATWIDGTLVPDSSERQAEKLLLLQNQSYEIPQRFKSLINNYEGKKLVGTYHSSVNGNEVIKVESYDPGQLIGEEASLKIKRWDKQTLAVTEEEISYSHFSDVLAKGLVGMSDSEKEGFTNLLDRQEKGKKEFEKLLATIKATYPPYMGGSIAPELRKVHDIEGSEDKMIPISWSMGADQSIVIHASTKDSQQKSIHVDGSSAYRYASLISTVHTMAEGEMNKGYIRSLAKVMGVDFGENVLYAKKNNEPFLSTKEGEVNALIVTSTDFLGITKNSQEKVSLDKTEQRDLKQFLLLEGLQEHTRLCNKVGVSMMKDYVNSLKDKEDITSGDYELLPSHTKVDKLYGEYWSKEEELHDSTHSSLVAREDRAALLADATTSFMSFKQELTKMVEAYNSQSSPISVDDIKKLKSLNAILSQKKGIGLPATINTSIDELEKRLVTAAAVNKGIQSKAHVSDNIEKTPLSPPIAIGLFFGDINEIKDSMGKENEDFEKPQRISQKEKGEAVQRIDRRIHELHRQNQELSHNTVHGNSAEPLARKYSPEKTGVQSATPSAAKIQKGFLNSKDIAKKVGLFLLNFSNSKEITADNFGKELIKSVQNPTNQLSDYIRFIDVNGAKTVLRLSDHSGNARNIIISGKKSDKGISLVIKTPSSSDHERKFRANSWAKVTEYIYDNPDRSRLHNIGRGIFDLLDRGAYIDLADANEINVSPRKNGIKRLMTPDGKLLGATWRGKIYLSPEAKGFEPPVHEYTHLWAGALQDRNYKEWCNVVSMMKESSLWNEVRNLHTELFVTDDIAEEVLATYSGRRGAERLESKFQAISDSNAGINERTAMAMSVNEVNNAVAKFWKVMSDYLHIHYTSAEEVADRVLYDYTKGLYPYNYSEAVEKKSKTKAYYISLEENGKDGRWHRPEIEERKAYNLYGNMLSDRLSLQMTYAELPWINAQRMQPCNLSKQPYEGIHGLMLALDVEKNGYALPIYITKEAAKEKGLLVKSDAISFPLVASLGVKEVYNIEQTDYPIKHAKEYETLKLEGISASRQFSPQATLHLLREKGAWPSQILYDGKQDLVSYSYADNSIHLAPAEKYPTPNNFQRDLSQGLIRSTRKVEARSTKYESMVKEELVSLIGSAMIGQKEHFCVTTPQQSSLWKQRLKEDTSYTKEVLRGAENASHLIYKRINEIKRSASQDLDLRTTTPISVDVDGNGIIESQENYAADKKQGSNESLDSPSDDIPRQEKKHWHR